MSKKMQSMKAVDKAADMATGIYKPSPEAMKRERDWKAEDAMRDIMRSEGHKKDKGLMADVKKKVKDTAKAVGC